MRIMRQCTVCGLWATMCMSVEYRERSNSKIWLKVGTKSRAHHASGQTKRVYLNWTDLRIRSLQKKTNLSDVTYPYKFRGKQKQRAGGFGSSRVGGNNLQSRFTCEALLCTGTKQDNFKITTQESSANSSCKFKFLRKQFAWWSN